VFTSYNENNNVPLCKMAIEADFQAIFLLNPSSCFSLSNREKNGFHNKILPCNKFGTLFADKFFSGDHQVPSDDN